MFSKSIKSYIQVHAYVHKHQGDFYLTQILFCYSKLLILRVHDRFSVYLYNVHAQHTAEFERKKKNTFDINKNRYMENAANNSRNSLDFRNSHVPMSPVLFQVASI